MALALLGDDLRLCLGQELLIAELLRHLFDLAIEAGDLLSKARLAKEIARLDGEIEKMAKKLGNEEFLAKAKPEVVAEQRERHAETAQARDTLRAALDRLG